MSEPLAPDFPQRHRSRMVLIGIVTLLIVWGLVHGSVPEPPRSAPPPNDTDLFAAVVARVRNGEPYYQVDSQELQARGYPTSSVFNWRLPTLTVLQAMLPSVGWSVAILTALGLASMTLWLILLRKVTIGWLFLATPFLLMTLPVWAWINKPSAFLHDLWAGQLIALSLACWAHGLRRWSLASGLAAVVIREFALPYVAMMAVMSWLDGRRRETSAWLGVGAVALAVLVWHAVHAMPLVTTTAMADGSMVNGWRANGWLAIGGWGFALKTTRVNVVLMLMPDWLLALLVPLAWGALMAWRTPAGRRVASTVTLYLALFTLVGRPDNWYWGLVVTPLLPLGVVGWLSSASHRG